MSDPQNILNRLGCVKKNDRNEIKSLEYFVVFKYKFKDKPKKLCLFKLGVLGYRNLQKCLSIMFIEFEVLGSQNTKN